MTGSKISQPGKNEMRKCRRLELALVSGCNLRVRVLFDLLHASLSQTERTKHTKCATSGSDAEASRAPPPPEPRIHQEPTQDPRILLAPFRVSCPPTHPPLIMARQASQKILFWLEDYTCPEQYGIEVRTIARGGSCFHTIANPTRSDPTIHSSVAR